MKLHNYLRLLVPVVIALGVTFTATAASDSDNLASQYATLEQNGSESPQEWFGVASAARNAGEVQWFEGFYSRSE